MTENVMLGVIGLVASLITAVFGYLNQRELSRQRGALAVTQSAVENTQTDIKRIEVHTNSMHEQLLSAHGIAEFDKGKTLGTAEGIASVAMTGKPSELSDLEKK